MAFSPTIVAILFLAFTTFVPASAQAQQAPAWEWAQRVGSSNVQYFSSYVAAGKSNNVYVAGSFIGTGTFGNIVLTTPGNKSSYVAKFRPNGTCAWALKLPVDWVYGIAVDEQENWFVTGAFQDTTTIGTDTLVSHGALDAFVAKYDSAAQPLWARHGGGASSDEGYAVTTDYQGNSFVTGRVFASGFFGSVQAGNGAFLAKYSPAGNLLWVRSGAGLNGYGVGTDEAGNCFMTGDYTYTANFGAAGTLQGTSETSMYVVKYDSAGNALWARSAGGSGRAYGRQVKADPNGNCIVTGALVDSVYFGNTGLKGNSWDVFVARYDSAGNLTWVNKYGSNSWDNATSVAIDSAGYAYITGRYSETVAFGPHNLSNSGDWDIFVVKIAPNGTVSWAAKAGGISGDTGSDIALGTPGTLYVTGHSYYGASFGSSSVPSSMGSYLARLNYSLLSTMPETLGSQPALRAWPNPFSNGISVTAGTSTGPAKVIITDVTGREIFSNQIEFDGSSAEYLPFPVSLSPGLYFLTCLQGDKVQILKIIKE